MKCSRLSAVGGSLCPPCPVWHYKRYSKSKELADLEVEARKKKNGLWFDPNPILPSEWRKQ